MQEFFESLFFGNLVFLLYYSVMCAFNLKMLFCEVELNRSADIGLLRECGAPIRDVLIERNSDGNFTIQCFNEFTQQENFLGQIEPSMTVATAMNHWLDFLHKDSFMAVYVDDYEIVIIDYYYPVGRQ